MAFSSALSPIFLLQTLAHPFLLLLVRHSSSMIYSSAEPCKDKVRMTFVEDDGNVIEVEAEPGQTLLEVAHENDVDLEGE